MDFELSEDQLMLQQAARDFARNELAPRAAASDAEESFVAEQIRLSAEMGFCGMSIPEAYGGSDLGAVGTSLVLIELNKACASTGVTLSVHNSLSAGAFMEAGTEEQKQRYLPRMASGEMLGAYALSEAGSGSDAGSLVCKATPDGDDWILSGSKLWISHGNVADLVIVFARTKQGAGSRGITAFIVETAWDGYKAGKSERKMGLRGSPTVEVQLDDVRVPAANVLGEIDRGFTLALHILNNGRIGIASQAVGICDACIESSTKYAKEREQFGQPVGHFGAIVEKVANMVARTEGARLLTMHAAALKDAGLDHRKEAAMAKLQASTAANFCAKEAVQIHGGAGYTRDFPVERFFRDARVTEIYEGTSEIQRLVIAREYLRT